ncbi:MAG: ABC transporter ATP-binding protein, partial [Ktedonobacterales bacterium]
MGFIMDGLDAEAYDRSYTDRQLITRIIGYFRPQLRLMIFVAVLVVLNSLADAVLPILLARGIDTLGHSITLQAVL